MKIIKKLGQVFSHPNSPLNLVGNYRRVIDSEGCEFGFEMYYHLGYAFHRYQTGQLKKTISCRDTECFYWFSPKHVEKYQRRQWLPRFEKIDQDPHQSPDFSRWALPDFQSEYENRGDFDWNRPPLIVFNKYNQEWDGTPINYLSTSFLLELIRATRAHYQVVYLRPTSKIVVDDSDVLDLHEKDRLRKEGAVMIEDLHTDHPEMSFNELQLCLMAQSNIRIAVQGGATYLNALFPGMLHILHRHGEEIEAGTYHHFKKMGLSQLCVHDNEDQILEDLLTAIGRPESKRKAA